MGKGRSRGAPRGALVPTRVGGALREIPRPHVWYYASGRAPRPVQIRVMRFDGIGVHFHVSITVVADYVWDARDGYWTRPAEVLGERAPGVARALVRARRTFHDDRFITPAQVNAYVATILKRYPAPRYVAETSTGAPWRTWHYRDGD